ncbi:GntR family transcriptional regulator [Paenibacillus sp. FA6]|uniref:GntR family transcriptional regulator n=1 Tax=Paenibacillus sp. FA6 TaxID=3413029 RepID=UPI003F65770F
MSISRKKGPLYLQIKKIIKDRILHGLYPIGTNIPSEPQLESEFKVSKMTVRNAIQELSQEGYVEKKSGIGTIVIRNTSFSNLSKGKRFTEVLVEEGHKIEKRILTLEWMENDEKTELFEFFGERCLRIERLYLLDGKPYIHYVHFLSPVIMMNEHLDVTEIQSIYELIEDNNIEIANFRDHFTVAAATAEIEQWLSVPEGTAMLKRLRYSYDANGSVVEYSVGHYNSEMQHYIVNYDV